MTLLETITIASYAYTTLIAGWLYRKIDVLGSNHYKHLAARIAALEARSEVDGPDPTPSDH